MVDAVQAVYRRLLLLPLSRSQSKLVIVTCHLNDAIKRIHAFKHFKQHHSFGIFGRAAAAATTSATTVLFSCSKHIQNNRKHFECIRSTNICYFFAFPLAFFGIAFAADNEITQTGRHSLAEQHFWHCSFDLIYPFGQMTCIFSTISACKRNAPDFFSFFS